MKDVKNAKLRKILDKKGIKDIVLNFDGGTVAVWSEDDLTDIILHYADNIIPAVATFAQMPIDFWVEEITRIFDEGLNRYERSKDVERNKDGDIVIKLG